MRQLLLALVLTGCAGAIVDLIQKRKTAEPLAQYGLTDNDL